MSFRRDKEKTEDWRAWLRRHREALAGCGLPDTVLRDRRLWGRFLDHGYCQESGWWLDFLSAHAARNLYCFLIAECGDDVDSWLLQDLRRLAASGKAAGGGRPKTDSFLQPADMLAHLEARLGERQLRLWAVACCRRLWASLADPRSRWAVDTAQAFAEGLADATALGRARADAEAARAERQPEEDSWGEPEIDPAADAAARVASVPLGQEEALASATSAAYAAAGVRALYASFRAPLAASVAREQMVQCRLLGCVAGPASSPLINPAWLAWNGGVVRRLAASVCDGRLLPSGHLDPARLAVLADALEEAGCCDADILGHLRGPGPHTRGCFVLDRLVGKA